MGAKYCGNSQVQDQGGEEKGKHHFHHFVAQVSGLRRYLKALMVPSWVCALQLKHKAAIRSLFDQVTRTLVLEVNHLFKSYRWTVHERTIAILSLVTNPL